jgi:6-phosphogluconolactonase
MTRLAPLLGLLLAAPADESRPAPPPATTGPHWVYVGTYTGGKSKGIYRLDFDPATGALGEPSLAAESESPSFLAVHPSRRFLYAVNEVGQFAGQPGGGATSFALDPGSGSLSRLNAEPTAGTFPCHLAVDRTGRMLMVANYGGGSVASFPIGADGAIGKASVVDQHRGSGPDRSRQEGPHAHSVDVDPGNNFVVSADLGLDRLFVYRLDPSRGSIAPNQPPAVAVEPGSGPRHFAFHPDGKHAYSIHEMASIINVFDYDPARGALTQQQAIRTLPKGFTGANTTAEVRVHPSGRFLYGSNRGDDSLAVYQIDPGNGLVSLVEVEPSGGKTPRSFSIDPTGRYLLAANQDSDSIVVFRIDPETGALDPTGRKVEVGKPVCLVFVPKGG